MNRGDMMETQQLHEHTLLLYQMERREDPPGTDLALKLSDYGGLVGLVGRTMDRVLERFPVRSRGPTYVVFESGGLTVRYELLLMEMEIGKSGDSLELSHLKLSQFQHLKTVPVVLPWDNEMVVTNHCLEFSRDSGYNGEVRQSRMGPVIRYPQGLSREEVDRIEGYYLSMDAEFRPEKKEHDLAKKVVRIIREKGLLS